VAIFAVLALALSAPVNTPANTSTDEILLLDFTATWCGPCQQMKPVVSALYQAGYPVRVVDVDQHGALARRLGVDSYPSFLIMKNNQVVAKREGVCGYQDLVGMFTQAGFRLGGNEPLANSRTGTSEITRPQTRQPHAQQPLAQQPRQQPRQSQHSRDPSFEIHDAGLHGDGGRLDGGRTNFSNIPPTNNLPSTNNNLPINNGRQPSSAQEAAYWSTVRLKVVENEGFSYGTGTIVDTHGGDALILTCGHLFRESGGESAIEVEFFHPDHKGKVRGTLLHFDANQDDLALVAIRPGFQVTPAKVGSTNLQPRIGDGVFSFGCNRGADPTVMRGKVERFSKFSGGAKIETSGQPVEGRSGGGLFNNDGVLIGVCNAADPQLQCGLYAALQAVQTHLDRIGQSDIYRVNNVANTNPETQPQSLAPAPIRQGDTEILLIRIRNGERSGETMILNNPSPETLKRLRQEIEMQRSGGSLQANANSNWPRALYRQQTPIVRGQSE